MYTDQTRSSRIGDVIRRRNFISWEHPAIKATLPLIDMGTWCSAVPTGCRRSPNTQTEYGRMG